jgi:hypothetical protein
MQGVELRIESIWWSSSWTLLWLGKALVRLKASKETRSNKLERRILVIVRCIVVKEEEYRQVDSGDAGYSIDGLRFLVHS